VPASHEIQATRFAASPDDRAAFEFLEEHLFMQADWPALADLYRRRSAAPSLAAHARQRAELALRLAQICEERIGDLAAAIRAYTEAVQLEPKFRRALRQLRRLYEARGSWEAVLQLGEQEAALAETAEERARAYVVMADVWKRHLGDPDQAEQLYARARAEGWADPHAGASAAPATVWPVPAPASAPAAPTPTAAAVEPEDDEEFQFYPDLEIDEELGDPALDLADEAPADDEPQTQLMITMPDLESAPPSFAQRAQASRSEPQASEAHQVGERRPSGGTEQRSARVLGVLERKLAERESRGAGFDAEALHLRLRIAELRAGVLANPVAAIAALEPALARPDALVEVAPTLAGLYEQLGRSEPLIDLAERAASASQVREQRVFWLRRAAEAARAAGAPERAIECYRRVLADLPLDHGARAALADLFRSRGDAAPLVGLLREELPRADRERELELQRELATLVAEALGDPVAAIPHLRRCVELEPERTDLLEWALTACALSGGPLAQLDLLEHACDRADADAVRAALLARRGTLLADALQWNAEAAESWRAALALDPNHALARERLGVAGA
jgi:tetratricopeptide (TPR) repeat protein